MYDRLSLTADSQFPGELPDWTVVGPQDNFFIENDAAVILADELQVTSASRQYEFPDKIENATFVQVSGVVDSTVRSGSPDTTSVEPTIFLLWFESADKPRFWVEWVTALPQTTPAETVSKTVRIPESATSVHVGLLLREYSSVHSLRELSIELKEYSKSYLLAISLLMLIALLVVFFVFSKAKRLIGGVSLLKMGAAFLLILVGILLSGNSLERFLVPIYQLLRLPIDIHGHPEFGNLFNYGHFFAFCVFTYLVMGFAREAQANISLTLLNLATFVFITEGLQRHRVDRLVEINDIILDFLGIILGIVAWCLLSKKSHPRG